MASDPFTGVIGQDAAVRILRAAEGREAHAWLLIGPPGTGTRAAARALAAGVVAGATEGSERERHISLALAEKHPDLIIKEPAGRTLRREEASEVIGAAFRSPTEGERKVVIATQLHAAEPAALASLLKTVEEPPPSTVFVLLADEVVPELVTIASRCINIEFGPIPSALMVDALEADGIERSVAERAATAAGGDLDRARLLATDANLAARAELWAYAPMRLDGTGAAVHALVGEIRVAVDASVEPLAELHEAQRAEVDERAERYGERGSGRRQLDEAQKREVRRIRTDELRFGLATLARSYRDAAVDGPVTPAQVEAVSTIDAAAEDLLFNPNEALWLQGLFLRLPTFSEE
jgi:DNA polymerase-3 subunit delta'